MAKLDLSLRLKTPLDKEKLKQYLASNGGMGLLAGSNFFIPKGIKLDLGGVLTNPALQSLLEAREGQLSAFYFASQIIRKH